jgi:tetratricopeptide (TPR) repeat protein
MRWMFQTLFPDFKVDPALPIVVIAVKNEQSVRSFEPDVYLAKGQMSLAGLFLRTPDKNYVLLRLDAEGDHPYATIYHEYTHLQFTDVSDWMPLWLNEGFAEFIQNTEIRNKDVLLGEPSVDDILYLRQNPLLPLATLFNADRNSPYYHEEQKASVFYAESWALTHYLEVVDHNRGTRHLSNYMTLVRQHETPVVAAEKAFGDLDKLQVALESYIHASAYTHFILSSAAAPLDESAYKGETLTQSQADAYRADFLVNVQRTNEARPLLNAVLKSDPDNVQAHETMGYLAYRDGDTEAARKWYEQAVKLGSQSYLAHYYFAVMSMNDTASVHNPEIEASLRTAIRLNPGFAPAYDELATLFAMRHENLDEARKLNLQAIRLDPNALMYRVNAASVLMTMCKYDDAASVLRNSLRVTKNPDEAAMVQRRLKEVESIRALGVQPSRMITAPSTSLVAMETAEKAADVDEAPKHPTEPANGPKHLALGVIRDVTCSYPAMIEFQVDTTEKPVSLYSNNYFKIDFTVLNFTPKGGVNPCEDIEGMKAQARYAESSDKTIDGQVIAIELMK